MNSWRGWTIEHVRQYTQAMVRKNGLSVASRLSGVSAPTLLRFISGKSVSLGTIVKIAESMP